VPSSMIFVGLVVMWLLILVPAVARHRQEVARPSASALAGRVLPRQPGRDPEPAREPATGRDVEVDVRQELEPARTEHEDRPPVPEQRRAPDARRAEALDTDHDAPSRPRYRPGRGGYDPEAAAATARARYAFRQRVVLTLLLLAVGTAVAAFLRTSLLWWAHGGVDLLLVGYLVYLRRQVRVEEAIRRRRAARAGVGRRPADEDAERRAVDRRPAASETSGDLDGPAADASPQDADLGAPEVTATSAAEPPPRDVVVDEPEDTPALPRLKPMPPPPVPIGTTLVDAADEEPSPHELESLARPDYRRASGQ
jgi:hypothetical protein